jgi:serine/threonine protein kinase
MTPDDRPHSDEAASDDPALAEALHRALERVERGDPPERGDPLPERVEDRERLDDSLEVARRLDQLVGYVEDVLGINVASPKADKAETFGPGTGLPQPFPGEYVIRRLLGEGAFGQVWLADDLKLGIPVALKTIRPRGGVEQRSQALAALQRDARTLARLKHPNIVQVHGWRKAGGDDYLVLQYVPGQSLKVRLEAAGPLGWRQAARYVADVAEALGHVHTCGLVHRDIKPANLLWDEARDEVLLTDFGLSAWLAEAEAGEAAGTAPYMAPESFQGQGGMAADVYGLAATLFHLVTGEPPFTGSSIQERLDRAAQGLPDPDYRCAALPAGLEGVIRNALVADPWRRPGVGEFAAGLRGYFNKYLTDSLLAPSGAAVPPAGPAVRLTVFRRGDNGKYTSLAAVQRALPRLVRNLELVPPEPERVVLHTGDRVRIEAVADRDGFLTVFNVGPTGNLTLLYPDPAMAASPAKVPANQPVLIAEVQVIPPAGSERLFAVWSRTALPLSLAELARQASSESPVSRAYRATRNLVRVEQSVQGLRGEDWQVAVVELEHRPT